MRWEDWRPSKNIIDCRDLDFNCRTSGIMDYHVFNPWIEIAAAFAMICFGLKCLGVFWNRKNRK